MARTDPLGGHVSSSWAELSTGERIKRLRGSDLTRQGLAEAAGVSLSLVQKAEQDKGDLSVASLLKFAAALKADVSVILGQQAPRRGMTRDTRAALRQLSDAVYDSALGEWEGIGEPSPLEELERARDLAWAAYWHSDNAKLSELASRVLVEGRARYERADGRERERLALVLASTYRVAASCANGFGRRELALGALASARALAEVGGDRALAGLLDSTLSWVQLRGAKLPRAVAVAERAANRIEPSFRNPCRPELLAYGRLMISAAVAASRKHDAAWAADYLAQAHAAAARLGSDQAMYGTHFGPTAANTEAVGIAVALGEYGKALKLAEHTETPAHMTKVARNRYLLDIALAQCETKQYDKATETLITVGRDAPEWVRHQALPSVIGRRLAKQSTAKVRRISDAIGTPLLD